MNAPNSAANAMILLNQATVEESIIASPMRDPVEASAAIDPMAMAGYPITVPIPRAPRNTAPAARYITIVVDGLCPCLHVNSGDSDSEAVAVLSASSIGQLQNEKCRLIYFNLFRIDQIIIFRISNDVTDGNTCLVGGLESTSESCKLS